MFNIHLSPRKREKGIEAEETHEEVIAQIFKFYGKNKIKKKKNIHPRNTISHKQDIFFKEKEN